MLDIIVLYSPDRLKQLKQMLFCLSEMEGISDCKIIICVDGKNNYISEYDNVLIKEVKRKYKYYCWADCINSGLESAEKEKILYLDSDRILPVNYLNLINCLIDDYSFVFPKYLKQFQLDHDLSTIRHVRDNPGSLNHLYIDDSRVYSHPFDAVRKKNPMAGCVAFTKRGYKHSGGFDPSFFGGCYADVDFYMNVYSKDYNLIAIDCVEYHLNHSYFDYFYETKTSMPNFITRLMGLFNGLKFCKKWNFKIHPRLIDASLELGVNIDDLKDISLDDLFKKYGIKRFVKL